MGWGSFSKMIASTMPRFINSVVTIPQIVSKNKILKHLPGMDAVNVAYDKLWKPQVHKMNQEFGLTGSQYEIK